MYKLKYKDYLFYDEFCYIKYKNKEFSNFDELKRYLYKHPYNVGHYDIIIVNTNVRTPYTKENFFKRLYTLDSSNARSFLDKFSVIRHVYISKNLDEIYGESVEVFNFIESFDFGLMYGDHEVLKKHDIVEIDPYFANSIYDWQCMDISLIIKYGMVGYCDYNKDSLFSKCSVHCGLDTLEIKDDIIENVWYDDLKFYPRSLMKKVHDPDVIEKYTKLIKSNFFSPNEDYFKEED